MNSFLFPRCDLSSVLPTWAMGFIRSRDWIWRLSMVIIIANHLLFGRAAADWFIIETRRICSCKFLCIPRKKSSPVIIPVDLACNRHAFSMQSTKWSESFGNARKRERVINPNQSFNNGPLNQVSPYFRSAPSVETKGLDRYLYGVPYTHTQFSPTQSSNGWCSTWLLYTFSPRVEKEKLEERGHNPFVLHKETWHS